MTNVASGLTKLPRRTALGAVALLGLLAPGLPGPARGQAAGAAQVEQAVERLRRLMLEPDRAALEQLLADQLSYGHSDGRVQDKAECIDSLITHRSAFSSITLSDQTIVVSGDVAVVRHRFAADAVSNGKASQPRIAIVQVWQVQAGAWRLLVRQAH